MMKKLHKLAWCNWYTLPKMPRRAPNPHYWPVSKQSAYFPGYYFAKYDWKGRDIAKSWRRAAESIDAKVHYQVIRSSGAEITKTKIMVAKKTKSAIKFWVCSLYLQFLSGWTRLKLKTDTYNHWSWPSIMMRKIRIREETNLWPVLVMPKGHYAQLIHISVTTACCTW